MDVGTAVVQASRTAREKSRQTTPPGSGVTASQSASLELSAEGGDGEATWEATVNAAPSYPTSGYVRDSEGNEQHVVLGLHESESGSFTYDFDEETDVTIEYSVGTETVTGTVTVGPGEGGGGGLPLAVLSAGAAGLLGLIVLLVL